MQRSIAFFQSVDRGAKIKRVVPLGNAPTSPIHGTAMLTQEQERQLAAGQWYVNVHTKEDPAGAIRGQMMAVK